MLNKSSRNIEKSKPDYEGLTAEEIQRQEIIKQYYELIDKAAEAGDREKWNDALNYLSQAIAIECYNPPFVALDLSAQIYEYYLSNLSLAEEYWKKFDELSNHPPKKQAKFYYRNGLYSKAIKPLEKISEFFLKSIEQNLKFTNGELFVEKRTGKEEVEWFNMLLDCYERESMECDLRKRLTDLVPQIEKLLNED